MIQIPSTPTPIPTVDPATLDLQMDLSLWDMTDPAIQTWNSFASITIVFQAVILFGIILFILMMIYRYAKIITIVRND